MDVNNTPYCLIRTAEEFDQGSTRLRWNTALQALTLAQQQTLRLPASNPAAALAAWATATPLALDGFNQMARLSADKARVEFNSGRGFFTLKDEELQDVAPWVFDNNGVRVDAAGTFTDLHLGGDGRLALPFTFAGDAQSPRQHGLTVFHLARRWQTFCALTLDTDGTTPLTAPLRASVDCDNQIWLVNTTHLLLCSGEPLPLPYNDDPARFEPVTINPHALALQWTQALPTGWQPLALCSDDTTVYVLAHDGAQQQAILTRPRTPQTTAPWRVHACAANVPFVIDLMLATDSSYPVPGRLAALAPRQAGDTAFTQRDATILELRWHPATDITPATGSAELVEERYPMLSLAVPRFVASADGQLRYQADADPDYPSFVPRARELHALRRPEYPLEASAMLLRPLDAGQPDACWHRLYLDASIPPGCAIEIGARVYNSPDQRGSAPVLIQPKPLWNPLPSELGFAESLAPYQPGSGGLFEILLQRPQDHGPVRRLTGRYLQLQITLKGNGRQTPCLYAIRAYYPRFSYQEAYLPELFRQERSFDPAAAEGDANGADVRERLLAAFEGVLTPIEGRIAASDQLVHPDATPAHNLPWLAEILGTELPTHWPEPRQRRLVNQATLIQQYKGTLYGVSLALDIASDGGLQRGEIVLVENFRLRRTMATILGIRIDDADHPLTLGTGMSGNSIVGDSLILSETDAREFLALFAPAQATKDETARVNAFFEQYAHQVTVLLHGRGKQLRDRVDAVLKEQMPAHLQWQIFETEHPFVLGLAPLLTVDTFIDTTPDFKRVALDDTYLGREGILKNPAAFSPADINAQSL